jgi:hypothetical protein
MKLSDVIACARDRKNLNEIERDYLRVKATGEVFTPLSVITKKLNDLEKHDPSLFKNPSNTFLEPSCGDGNFLSEVLIRKMENGSTFEQALSTIYGVDLMQDNVDLCRERLLCGREDLRHVVEQNIYQADGLKFSYEFKPMSETRRKREQLHRQRAEKARLVAEQARIIKEREIILFGKDSNKPKKSKKQELVAQI